MNNAHHKKILIADDEPYILHVLEIKLHNAGYTVVTAADGEEALELCLQEQPDLIITDYQMPFLSGVDLCREYRRRSGRDVPAILVTAREFDMDRRHFSAAGIRALVGKPFSPREIIRTVGGLLPIGGTSPSPTADCESA